MSAPVVSDPVLISSPEAVAQLFTRADGYAFARWNRPIVPVLFGIEEATLSIFKGALEVVVGLAGHKMNDHDPDLGANLMFFFCRSWSDLLEVPNLHQLIDGLPDLVGRLQGQDANQYRMFRFDPEGGIRAAFVFLRMDEALSEAPAEWVALDQAMRVILPWAEGALAHGALISEGETVVLRPDLLSVIQAAYDPILPVAAWDASHAFRVFARMGR